MQLPALVVVLADVSSFYVWNYLTLEEVKVTLVLNDVSWLESIIHSLPRNVDDSFDRDPATPRQTTPAKFTFH